MEFERLASGGSFFILFFDKSPFETPNLDLRRDIMYKYELIVGSRGKVLETNDRTEAERKYYEFVHDSLAGAAGRSGDDTVTLLEDGKVWVEFDPKLVSVKG